ncbi:hypothetical protein OB919_08345 [Halobacteria archaeon AArc-curdl1]|uniref:DUF8152 domain-containing protein n=1 Tax=Natronosalvus hydrolyticus TaxID=2979988 RepID=A0AAP3E620_9EURY|nr:hypothetical protein [Halobacteria archaeon AArc-curdl1]
MGKEDSDTSLENRLNLLHERLEATAELPIDHRTNRWLGEAEAVVRDAAMNTLDEATTKKRVRQAKHLLEEADGTGNEQADEHLEAALELCHSILEDG